MKLKEMFLKNFVFGFGEEVEDVILRSNYKMASDVMVELCDKSEKLNNMRISDLLNFFNVKGDLEDLKTYKKLDNVCKEAKNLDEVYDISTKPEGSKLRLYKALVGAVHKYLNNRNKELEKSFESFIAADISARDISLAICVLTGNPADKLEADKLEADLKVAEYYILIAKQLKKLMKDPAFNSGDNKSYKLYKSFEIDNKNI